VGTTITQAGNQNQKSQIENPNMPPTQLEQITRGTTIRGILPDGLVTVIDVRWVGTVAVEVTYKDAAGRLGNELIYRDREPTLDLVEAGRPWSFDAKW
jgi:hypothetical protein